MESIICDVIIERYIEMYSFTDNSYKNLTYKRIDMNYI